MNRASAIRIGLPSTYRLECEEAELGALEQTCVGARDILRNRLRAAEKSLAYWQTRPANERPNELDVVQSDVNYCREQLAKAEKALATLVRARPVRLSS